MSQTKYTVDPRTLPVTGVGTCSACGYYGPGPGHACPVWNEKHKDVERRDDGLLPGSTDVTTDLQPGGGLDEPGTFNFDGFDLALSDLAFAAAFNYLATNGGRGRLGARFTGSR